MTTKITVSVNGHYKLPITISGPHQTVSDVVRGKESEDGGPKVVAFEVFHGSTVSAGPEEQDVD